MNTALIYEEETYAIRGAIFDVYNEMKNGYREEVYQQCIELELSARAIPFQSKPELHVTYNGTRIEKTYIPDLVCYGKIIVELKAVTTLSDEHRAQLLNYLRLTKMRLGLLVNFASYPRVTIERWALSPKDRNNLEQLIRLQ